MLVPATVINKCTDFTRAMTNYYPRPPTASRLRLTPASFEQFAELFRASHHVLHEPTALVCRQAGTSFGTSYARRDTFLLGRENTQLNSYTAREMFLSYHVASSFIKRNTLLRFIRRLNHSQTVPESTQHSSLKSPSFTASETLATRPDECQNPIPIPKCPSQRQEVQLRPASQSASQSLV